MTKIFALAGPTCIGKTALSLTLAQSLNAEIISVDSALVYRGLDIGSAKPSLEERGIVAHHLIDIRQPWQPYSVSDFIQDARASIASIHARNKSVLMVGGTMLYFKGIIEGISTLPPSDPSIRQALQAQMQYEGLDYLYEQLKILDPVSAEQLHPNDQQRIMRALEVSIAANAPYSEMIRCYPNVNGLGDQIRLASLVPSDRHLLHENIALRFRMMCEHDFLAEVKGLMRHANMNADLPSMRSVGYRQAWEHLQGQCDYATFIEKGIVATRQLAKRQLTWIRNWTHPQKIIEMPNEKALDQLIAYFTKD